MDTSQTVSMLLGLAREGLPDPQAALRVADATGLGKPITSWLWEGYMLRRKITMIDAKGGAGKSRLLLAIAACASRGLFPFNGYDQAAPWKCEPSSTLYFSTEDEAEEVAETFDELGGDRRRFHIYDPDTMPPISLDSAGADRLIEVINEMGVSMVVLDPLLEYAPKDFRNQNDNTAITKFLRELRRVGTSTGVAIAAVRHFAKGMEGRGLSELGAGGEAWRNGARGQLVMLPHPENGRRPEWHQALVMPARNTMRVQYGPVFGIQIERGEQTFIKPQDVDLAPYIEHYPPLRHLGPKEEAAPVARGKRGPDSKATRAAAEAIIDFIRTNGPTHFATVRDAVEGQGHRRASVYEAKKRLQADGTIIDEAGKWGFADDFDLFADDTSERWWIE